MMYRAIAIWLVCFLFCNVCVSAQADLSAGSWYRIAVAEEGVYKIDRSVLNDLGINTQALNPSHLRLYGYGGGMLPQSNAAARHEGLPEIPLGGSGISDNSFDNGDYFIFYTEGPDKRQYSAVNNAWEYEKNLYADSVYLFLTIDETGGKRVPTATPPQGSFPTIDQFSDLAVYESDVVNALESGRDWFGQLMSPLANTLTLPPFELPGLIQGTDIHLTTRVANFATSAANFTLTINSSQVSSQYTPPVTSDTYGVKVTTSEVNTLATAGSSATLDVEYTYETGSDPRATGALDYLTITAKRRLAYYGEPMVWVSPSALQHAHVTYKIGNAGSGLTVWDVTKTDSIVNVPLNLSAGNAYFNAEVSFPAPSRYILFDSQVPPAIAIGPVPNQNLKSKPVPDLLIVTHPSLRAQAERLASFRRSNDKLDVEVVTIQQIYNEFSSGSQDISAIRDYVRYLYQKQADKLSYLLLFGHASYDYKNRIENNLNLVPTYQSRNSYHSVLTYGSDDYYGFLEAHEGEWQESSVANDHTLDIGIGRIPAKDSGEAAQMVDKLIYYSSAAETLGPWRNRIIFVADDGDGNTHQRDADKLAGYVDTTYRAYNIRKLYLDSYRQQVQADRETSPAAKLALNDAINNGQFIVNYSGHGGPAGWTRETILDQNLIAQWENIDQLPIFVTATCEFGQHDNPLQISAGEKLLLKPDGGAIGLVTTTRPVYAYTNYLLNREFYKHLSSPEGETDKRLGDIFRETKNGSVNGVNNRNFTLLGDPSMLPAFPRNRVVIDEINGKSPESLTDTLRATSLATVKGRILNPSSNIDPAFYGRLELTLFDKPVQKETFGTEGTSPLAYTERDNVLFRGQGTVSEGRFTVEIPLPKNLNYAVGEGKISLYGYSSDGEKDANGSEYRVLIGGTEDPFSTESTPPEIKLFLNDTTFREGDVISPDAVLYAVLSDQSGINVSRNGIGQDIVLTSNDENTNTLNDFYISAPDDYSKGMISYPLSELPEGRNTLRLAAWDNMNNKGEAEISFIVSGEGELLLSDVGNYPNPFSSQTTFTFRHNRPGENLSVTIDILDVTGRPVHHIYQDFTNSPTLIEMDVWDLANASGNQLVPGVYLYRLTVTDSRGLKKATVKRLVCSK